MRVLECLDLIDSSSGIQEMLGTVLFTSQHYSQKLQTIII